MAPSVTPRRLICAFVLFSSLASACGGSDARDGEQLARQDFGDAWPFTAERVTLRCGDVQRNHVVVEADGVTYALNGSARGSAAVKEGAWKDSAGILRTDPTLVGNPAFDRPFVMLPDGLIDRGLKLCEAGQ